MPNVTILHESQEEWETEFESVTEVRVDGQKLNDIHDLTKKVDKITKIIKVLAITATCLTVIAVGGVSYIGSWLAINNDKIASAMDTSKEIKELTNSNMNMSYKLNSLGWHDIGMRTDGLRVWEDADWQQIAVSPDDYMALP